MEWFRDFFYVQPSVFNKSTEKGLKKDKFEYLRLKICGEWEISRI